jgi:hypothetical protein
MDHAVGVRNGKSWKEKVEVSVARYLRTPPYGATRKGLI